MKYLTLKMAFFFFLAARHRAVIRQGRRPSIPSLGSLYRRGRKGGKEFWERVEMMERAIVVMDKKYGKRKKKSERDDGGQKRARQKVNAGEDVVA